MKTFVKLFSLLLLTLSLTLSAAPDTRNWVNPPERSWHLTLESALKAAKKSGKKIFVFHTGSDWCGWCVRLKKDVLMTPEFQTFAQKNLEFVYLDSPSKRIPMPDDQRRYNNDTWRSLKGGGGVPCALVLDPQGKRLGTMSGYRPLQSYMSSLTALTGAAASDNRPAAPAPVPAAKAAAGEFLPAPEGWLNKLEPALVQAKKENKKVLILSTGSDWCPPCKKFGSVCLPSEEFKTFVKANLVPVYLDLPRRKNMPSAQLAYNRNIIAKLGLNRSVPTFAILNSQGETLAQFSGFSSTPAFMTRLKSAINATPRDFKAQTEDRQKAIAALRSAKITIAGWKLTPEDPMHTLAELPETLPARQRVYFYLDYDLPKDLSCKILLTAPGTATRRQNTPLTGKGRIETALTFNSSKVNHVKFLLIYLLSEKANIIYRRIPCNIKLAP